jgi:hypothetical protein
MKEDENDNDKARQKDMVQEIPMDGRNESCRKIRTSQRN